MTTQEKLIMLYEKAERRLKLIILQKGVYSSSANYQRSLLRQITKELERLRSVSGRLVQNLTEEAYTEGLDEFINDLKEYSITAKEGAVSRSIAAMTEKPAAQLSMSGLNKSQIRIIAENTNYDFNKAIDLIGRRINDNIRKAAIEAASENLTEGQTVRQMQKSLEQKLQLQNITAVEYSNGTQMPLKSYAEMTARSTTAEAQNTAKAVQGKEWGYDLVRMTTHSPTCSVCAMYQGRVYALTREAANGKYKLRDGTHLYFPYLYETAFASGYSTIHPNCRHRISVFPANSYTSGELRSYSEKSTAPFEDTRSDQERKAYSAALAKRRRLLENRRQYEKIRIVLPDQAPKSFAGFMRMKCSNSEKYQNLMRDYRYVQKQIRESESSKPNITNQNAVVDKKVIESSNYRRQFDKLGEDKKVTRAVYQQAKATLNHRSGGSFEDLSYIDSRTGKIMTRTDYDVERQCMPSEAMKKMVSESEPYTIISLHNHPNNTVPSLDALNSSYKKKYKYGVIACHNGNVFKYRVLGEYDNQAVDLTLDRLNNVIYNEDIDNREEKINNTLQYLLMNNIEMEVFLWR